MVDRKASQPPRKKAVIGATTPFYGANATMKEQVEAVLAREAEFSVVGVTGDLHSLSNLVPLNSTTDGTIPILRHYNREILTRAPPSVVVSRMEAIHKTLAPSEKGELWEALGKTLVVAGGAVCNAIRRRVNTPARGRWGEDTVKDIDLFLVGLGEEEARRQINMLADELRTAYSVIMIYRTERCITFRLSTRSFVPGTDAWKPISFTIQVVLRLYNTVSEIVHGFDLGSSAVAFAGGAVVMSAKGRFAYERGANILDLSRRRASYEERIVKYAKHGFDIVLPQFNIRKDHKVSTSGEYIALPCLRIFIPSSCSSSAAFSYLIVGTMEAVHPPHSRADLDAMIGARSLIHISGFLADGIVYNYNTDTIERSKRCRFDGTEIETEFTKTVWDAKSAADLIHGELGAADEASAAEMKSFLESSLASHMPIVSAVYGYLFIDEAFMEEDEDFNSEYYGGDNYFRLGRITWNNLRQAQAAVVKTASLCLFTTYAQSDAPIDVCVAGRPFVGLRQILKRWCGPGARQPECLVALLGKETTRRIFVAIIDGTFVGYEKLADALHARYAERAQLPFRFMRVEDSTCLAGGGVLRMALMTPEEWYGDYYAPPEK